MSGYLHDPVPDPLKDDMVVRLRSLDECLRYSECNECGWQARHDRPASCACSCHDMPWHEAADEIERLRAEVDRLSRPCQCGHPGWACTEP